MKTKTIKTYTKSEEVRRKEAKEKFYQYLKAQADNKQLRNTLSHTLHVCVSGDIN